MKTKLITKTGFKKEMLEHHRISSGKSMSQLAEIVGCDVSSMSLWESGNRRPSPKMLRRISEALKVPVSAFFLLLLMTTLAHASIDRKTAITAIVGEAANQGFDGMTAVGEVIRNRGSVRGIYGLGAMKKRIEPASVWKLAARAWDRSATSNLTHGATLFENISAFGFPKSWDRSKLTCVAQIKDHWFFTEE